jgi:hypothetical protein
MSYFRATESAPATVCFLPATVSFRPRSDASLRVHPPTASRAFCLVASLFLLPFGAACHPRAATAAHEKASKTGAAGGGSSDNRSTGRALAPAPIRESVWAATLLSGGGAPENNAVAHERNVLFARRSLVSLGLAAAHQTVLFADGQGPDFDTQFEETDPARYRRLYALGLYRGVEGARDAVLRYRNHELGAVLPADLDTVRNQLEQDADRAREKLPHTAPMLLYVTDHGLKARDTSNNTILLWHDERLSVRMLGRSLDAQPPERRVVSVMAQCFSGSFAALVHEGGDPARPLAPHDRCGFFAAPKDRPAAGCSPRTDESLYDDYTTRFFAALSGKTRTGQPAPPADLDGDGAITLSEAHFAAVLLEDTMDVPVTTSEELLRRERAEWLALLDRDATAIGTLLDVARAPLRQVGERLLQQLGAPRSTPIRRLDDWLDEAEDGCFPGFCEAIDEALALRQQIHGGLARTASFPPPTDRADWTLATIGSARIDAWVQKGAPELARLLRVEGEIARLRAASESLDGRRRRLLRLIELVWLERVLRRQGGPLLSAYERVRACEDSRLDLPRAATEAPLELGKVDTK